MPRRNGRARPIDRPRASAWRLAGSVATPHPTARAARPWPAAPAPHPARRERDCCSASFEAALGILLDACRESLPPVHLVGRRPTDHASRPPNHREQIDSPARSTSLPATSCASRLAGRNSRSDSAESSLHRFVVAAALAGHAGFSQLNRQVGNIGEVGGRRSVNGNQLSGAIRC